MSALDFQCCHPRIEWLFRRRRQTAFIAAYAVDCRHSCGKNRKLAAHAVRTIGGPKPFRINVCNKGTRGRWAPWVGIPLSSELNRLPPQTGCRHSLSPAISCSPCGLGMANVSRKLIRVDLHSEAPIPPLGFSAGR